MSKLNLPSQLILASAYFFVIGGVLAVDFLIGTDRTGFIQVYLEGDRAMEGVLLNTVLSLISAAIILALFWRTGYGLLAGEKRWHTNAAIITKVLAVLHALAFIVVTALYVMGWFDLENFYWQGHQVAHAYSAAGIATFSTMLLLGGAAWVIHPFVLRSLNHREVSELFEDV